MNSVAFIGVFLCCSMVGFVCISWLNMEAVTFVFESFLLITLLFKFYYNKKRMLLFILFCFSFPFSLTFMSQRSFFGFLFFLPNFVQVVCPSFASIEN